MRALNIRKAQREEQEIKIKPNRPRHASAAIREAPQENPPAASPALRYYPALDGLRGVAVILIVLFHGFVFAPETLGEKALHVVTRAGWIGVDLFFVLSGFLITGILLDSRGAPHYFRSFYARRVLRIFPLYYLVLFVFFFVFIPLENPTTDTFHGWGLLEIETLQPWFWTFGFNLHVGFQGYPRATHLNHFWSLALEEQFYAVWPLLVLFLDRNRLRLACVGMLAGSFALRIALTLPGGGHEQILASTATRLDGLVMGALLAMAASGSGGMDRLAAPARRVLMATGAGLVVITILAGGFSAAESNLVLTLGLPLLCVFFTALVCLCAAPAQGGSLLQRVLAHPALRSIGKYSYAIYVLHMAVIFGLLRYGVTPAGLGSGVGGQLAGQFIFYALAGAGSYLAGLLSWNLYERHFLRLKRFFPRPTRTPSGAPTSPPIEPMPDPDRPNI